MYEQTVTQEFRSNYSVQKVDGKRYYNSYGNTVNASVTAPNGASMSGWSWRGWASAGVTSGNANVAYANGATIGGLTSSNVYYGLYQQTIYLYYNGNGSASGSVSTQSGTRYYSEGSGNSGTVNPSFKLASNGYSRSGYTFTGWNLGAVGATITLSSNTTAYAQWVQAVTNYGYTGGVQSFTAPASGTYKLEVWGAKGGYQSLGGSSGWDYGGNGGYSYGNVYLTAGQTIYVVCGGYNSITGGENAYNGGGAAYRWGGYGGGATHIATTNRGVLSNYDSYRSEVLIVAGGGGGSGAYCEVKDDDDEVIDDYYATGGSGGGTTGGNGDRYGGQGATQSAGGKGGPGWQVSEMSGSFGQGGYSDYHRGSGGGGGWYGGGGGESGQGGGGGSGYIGGVSSGGMSNGVNAGQGKAKITLIA